MSHKPALKARPVERGAPFRIRSILSTNAAARFNSPPTLNGRTAIQSTPAFAASSSYRLIVPLADDSAGSLAAPLAVPGKQKAGMAVSSCANVLRLVQTEGIRLYPRLISHTRSAARTKEIVRENDPFTVGSVNPHLSSSAVSLRCLRRCVFLFITPPKCYTTFCAAL